MPMLVGERGQPHYLAGVGLGGLVGWAGLGVGNCVWLGSTPSDQQPNLELITARGIRLYN